MITEEEGGGVGIFVIFHMVLFLTEGSIFPLKIVTPAPAILLHGGSLIYTCVCVCVCIALQGKQILTCHWWTDECVSLLEKVV